MPLSRRDFLKKVGLVAAAAAAPVLSSLPEIPEEPENEYDHYFEEVNDWGYTQQFYPSPRIAELLKMHESGLISHQTLGEMVKKEMNPPVIYYYDPTLYYEPAKLDFSPGAINYLVYDRERVEILRDGVWTEPPQITYVTEEEMRDLSS